MSFANTFVKKLAQRMLENPLEYAQEYWEMKKQIKELEWERDNLDSRCQDLWKHIGERLAMNSIGVMVWETETETEEGTPKQSYIGYTQPYRKSKKSIPKLATSIFLKT